MRKRNIDAAFLIGNAVELSPVGKIWHYHGKPDRSTKPEIIPFPNIHDETVSQTDLDIARYYQDQLWGRITSTNPHLLTHINLERGRKMKEALMTEHYPGWFSR